MVEVKNRFEIGDTLELMTPSGNYSFELRELLDTKGNAIDAAPGSPHVIKVPIAEELRDSISERDTQFGLLMRTLVSAPVQQ